MNAMFFYASRLGESPSYKLTATTERAAKAEATRLLQGGEVVLITVVEDQFGLVPDGPAWCRKHGRWTSNN